MRREYPYCEQCGKRNASVAMHGDLDLCSLCAALDLLEETDLAWRESGAILAGIKALYEKANGPGVSVECTTCHRRKAPWGRSVAPEMANGMCDGDCPGYRVGAEAGDLWPGETREDFGFGWPTFFTPEMRAAVRELKDPPIEKIRALLLSAGRSLEVTG